MIQIGTEIAKAILQLTNYVKLFCLHMSENLSTLQVIVYPSEVTSQLAARAVPYLSM